MDLLSHGFLGAATAQAVAPRSDTRVASAAGFGAALLPDVDAFFRSASDPLMVLEWHRHFTHSLVFIPVGALVAALLLWPWLRARLPFLRLYRYTFAGYALAGLLDASTTYGTHLLWPFSDARTSWSIISVVDPAFTIVVAVPALYGLLRLRPAAGRAALVLAGAYLAVGATQHQRVAGIAESLAQARGVHVQRVEVKPTFGNLILWRSMIVADGMVHVDAVHAGFGRARIYRGQSAALVLPDDALSVPAGSMAHRDVARFAYFADGLLTRQPHDPELIGDARYAMLPTSLRSIWSIRVDARQPEEHVELVVDRAMPPELRRCFVQMLLGRDAGLACARSPSGG